MKPNWEPLETKLGRERCVGFMYMGRINGINLYKHGIARRYLALDDRGQCFVQRHKQYQGVDFNVELAKIEAVLAEIGETLESSYNEEYIARKDQALEQAGLQVRRIQVEPEDVTVN